MMRVWPRGQILRVFVPPLFPRDSDVDLTLTPHHTTMWLPTALVAVTLPNRGAIPWPDIPNSLGSSLEEFGVPNRISDGLPQCTPES